MQVTNDKKYRTNKFSSNKERLNRFATDRFDEFELFLFLNFLHHEDVLECSFPEVSMVDDYTVVGLPRKTQLRRATSSLIFALASLLLPSELQCLLSVLFRDFSQVLGNILTTFFHISFSVPRIRQTMKKIESQKNLSVSSIEF